MKPRLQQADLILTPADRPSKQITCYGADLLPILDQAKTDGYICTSMDLKGVCEYVLTLVPKERFER